jgi:integrase
MTKALTTKAVENLRPGPERREIADRTPLLYLIVQPGTGRRRFALRYRFDGKSVKLTLPRSLTLAEARQAATAAGRDLDKGIDPRAAQRTAKVKAALAAADTVLAVCMSYQTREGVKLRTARTRLRLLEQHVFPVLGDRPIGSVRRGEIVRLLDTIEDRSGSRQSDIVLGILGRIMKWHALRDDTFNSPIVAGMGRHSIADHARSRVLDDTELRAVWQAAGDVGTFGAFVKFLLLTAGRRSEAAGLRWAEIVDGIWHLPAERNKTKQPLARPLSSAALTLLDTQPRLAGVPYVFTAGDGPWTSYSKPKTLLDAASGVTNWRLHDARRTSRTLLSRCAVSPDIAEMYLGHVLPIIRRTYDQHRYVDEMRHAAEALAQQIARIVDPTENVVALRRPPA